MAKDLFEQYVADAIEHIPRKYVSHLKHVAFIVEDRPTDLQRQKLHLRPCDALYGLYEGVPLPSRGGRVLTVPPDIITIFRYPMIDMFKESAALKKQIYETVWHEVGHMFGLDHAMIDGLKQV
ncbi:MAG TPA: metallopeptidase family protein [Candidatus Saccharibacteria bacterium]|jgi:predicted Zn-dependent protease with MMP-like domain|nr:metallopeptidase family protein [Candidatus Saccharibacteria bacterium]HMT55353.1 metallopeptidase family protein [Candidatus Saccharibacteria bacterium]